MQPPTRHLDSTLHRVLTEVYLSLFPAVKTQHPRCQAEPEVHPRGIRGTQSKPRSAVDWTAPDRVRLTLTRQLVMEMQPTIKNKAINGL